MTMGETVALYRVWDPGSVELYLETAFLKPVICSSLPLPLVFCWLKIVKDPVTAMQRFQPWGMPHLHSQGKGFTCSLV